MKTAVSGALLPVSRILALTAARVRRQRGHRTRGVATESSLAVIAIGALLITAVPAASASDWHHRSPTGAEVDFMVKADAELVVGTRRGLLYSSSDDGASWALVPAQGERTMSLVVNPRNRAQWHMLEAQIVGQTSVGYVQTSYAPRTIVSQDNGVTWTLLYRPGARSVLHPSAPKAMIPGITGVWFSSFDDGFMWTQYGAPSSFGLLRVIGLDIPGAPFGAMFSGVSGREFHLGNSGLTSWGPTVATIPDAGNFDWYERPSQPGQVIWKAGFNPFPGNQPYSELGIVDFTNGNQTALPNVVGLMSNALEEAGSSRVLALVAPNNGICDNCVRHQVWSLDSPAGPWTVRGTVVARGMFDSRLEQFDGKLWLLDDTIGVRRSDDGGVTWSAQNSGIREGIAAAVSIDPRNPQHLLAGRPLQSLQRSLDGGISWTDVGGEVPQDVRALARSPVNADHLLATSVEGLYRSTNAGASWQRVSTAIEPASGTLGWREVAWCATNDVDLLATVAWRLYRSTDGGANWSAVADPGTAGFGKLTTAIAAPGRTYLKSWYGDGLYATDNCGQTIAPVIGANAVAVDANYSLNLVGYRNATDRFYRSSDGGETWNDSSSPTYNSDTTFVGWIDGCDPRRFTDLRLHQSFGDGVRTELPGREDVSVFVRAAESRCIGGESVTLIGTDTGVWLYRGGDDAVFADAFEP